MQRVSSAKVKINSQIISSIENGLLVLLAVEKRDNDQDVNWMAKKLSNLRIFDDDQGKMNLSLTDVGAEMMVISNFTVAGDASKGNRPGFDKAAGFEEGKALFDQVLFSLSQLGIEPKTGEFGSEMQIELVNSGPVTIILDSPSKTT